MARSASTNRRPAARRPARTPRFPSGRGRAARTPPLSAPLERLLTGVAANCLGGLVAAGPALPGGGSVARPVHDAFYTVLGAGAWLAVAALILTGIRLCASRHWRAGEAAAAGSVLAVLALLGLTGLLAPG